MFPVHTGMNRGVTGGVGIYSGVPRTHGDEPILIMTASTGLSESKSPTAAALNIDMMRSADGFIKRLPTKSGKPGKLNFCGREINCWQSRVSTTTRLICTSTAALNRWHW
ncbi:hypothetical protein [Vibrio ruber]|uniref:hypothetical protein n=1 Tax=Vibrio ruber TaxID=184755 RepID=UPI00406AA66D